MIEWDDKYCFGISIINKEHKTIIDVVNKAIVAKQYRHNRKIIRGILSEVMEYAKKHFKTEETYMVKFNYPEYPYHKKEHSDFSLRILGYRIKLSNGDYQILDDIIKFLQEWLVHHIKETDKKYVDCFKKNGLK